MEYGPSRNPIANANEDDTRRGAHCQNPVVTLQNNLGCDDSGKSAGAGSIAHARRVEVRRLSRPQR